MSMKTKVYIASPYTKGDVAVNVKRQLDTFDELMTLGYAPHAPLYSHFQHMAHPRPYADWIAIDLEWVAACDVLLRLEGDSSGADGEVAFAQAHSIPVVFSVAELLTGFPAEPVEGSSSEPARSDKAILPAASAAPVEAVEVLRELIDATKDGFIQVDHGSRLVGTTAEFNAVLDRARTLVAQPPQSVQEVRPLTSAEANPILDEIVGNYPVDLAEQVQREFCRVNGLKLAATTEPKQ